MKKRVLCLIGAVALVLSSFFVLPAAAAYEPDVYAQELYSANYDTTYSMVDGLTVGDLYFIGDTLFVAVSDPLRISSSGYIPNGLEFTYNGERCVVVGLNTLDNTVTITQHDGSTPSEDYFYVYTAVDTGGSSEGTYQEGYDAGYSAGVAEGTDAGYQDGFEEGKDAGYQEGYDDAAKLASGYDYGYSQGLEAGLEQGFANGRADGLIEASKIYEQLGQNVFSFATVTAHGFTEAGDEEFTITVTPQLINNGISFSSVYTQLLTEIDRLMPGTDTLSSLDITLTWSEANSFDYGLLYFSSNQYDYVFSIGNGTSLSTLDPSVNAEQGLTTFRKYTSGAVVKNYSVRSVQLRWADLADQSLQFLQDLQLYTGGPYFTNGYAAGYTSGLNTSQGAALEKGKAEGFRNGYSRGKAEGIEITKNGDWYSLMGAVVDTPFNALMSLFSFEVLGLDMRVAFGSLLALCMFLFVVKKVIL